MAQRPIYVGVDVGSSRTKLVLLDAGKAMIGYAIRKSGTNFTTTADRCLETALEKGGVAFDDIAHTVSTGYGRKNVSFTQGAKTEISCHARGCFHHFPMPITIIDIGGQDNKVIKLDAKGHRLNFKMNRKCAAGTGAFLEEMALRLDIPLEDLNDLAAQSQNMERLGSFCTVFSGTEVLEKIRNGKKVPDIVKGLFFSVIRRVMEMDSVTENVVMTGGVVAHNPYLVTMAEELIERKVYVADHPQLTGALGAALWAADGHSF